MFFLVSLLEIRWTLRHVLSHRERADSACKKCDMLNKIVHLQHLRKVRVMGSSRRNFCKKYAA